MRIYKLSWSIGPEMNPLFYRHISADQENRFWPDSKTCWSQWNFFHKRCQYFPPLLLIITVPPYVFMNLQDTYFKLTFRAHRYSCKEPLLGPSHSCVCAGKGLCCQHKCVAARTAHDLGNSLAPFPTAERALVQNQEPEGTSVVISVLTMTWGHFQHSVKYCVLSNICGLSKAAEAGVHAEA